MSERVFVRDLKVGDKVEVDIIFAGHVLVTKGTVLNEGDIERLHRRFKNLDISVNVDNSEEHNELHISGQYTNDTNTISSLSGYREQKTVDVIHEMYGKTPDEWKGELSEIKDCMNHIVNNVKSSENLCYDLQDFVAEDRLERHLYRVAKIAIALANVHNGTVSESARINLTNIGMAALFHDYGKRFENKGEDISKLRIDNNLIKKLNLHPQFFKKPYDPSLHSVYAYAALKSTLSEEICKIILLSGLHNSIVNKFDPEIPEVKAAKAIVLCYAYDDLLERVIKDNMETPMENVLSVIDQGVKNGDFSRKAYKLFMDNILIYAPGTKVILTNGDYATVVGNNKSFPSRPLVFTDNARGVPQLIDLSETTNITIKEILIENSGLNRKVKELEATQLKNIVTQDN